MDGKQGDDTGTVRPGPDVLLLLGLGLVSAHLRGSVPHSWRAAQVHGHRCL